MNDIYVIDLETTGLTARDHIVEVAVCRAEPNTGGIELMYNSLVKYAKDDIIRWSYPNSWLAKNSDIRTEDILTEGRPIITVKRELISLLSDKVVTSYNTDFDFMRFLDREPFNMWYYYRHKAPCIMRMATNYLKKGHKKFNFKMANLEEATNYIVFGLPILKINQQTLDTIRDYGFHRASYDAFMASKIMLELINRGRY